MNSFTTIDIARGNTQIVDYGFRKDPTMRDISRYTHLLLDVGIEGNVLATYAIAIELLGARSYVCAMTTRDGSAPASVFNHMKVIADGMAINLGCNHVEILQAG